MQYSCHPIKGKNVSREKELAKKEFAVTFFSLLPVPNLLCSKYKIYSLP